MHTSERALVRHHRQRVLVPHQIDHPEKTGRRLGHRRAVRRDVHGSDHVVLRGFPRALVHQLLQRARA